MESVFIRISDLDRKLRRRIPYKCNREYKKTVAYSNHAYGVGEATKIPPRTMREKSSTRQEHDQSRRSWRVVSLNPNQLKRKYRLPQLEIMNTAWLPTIALKAALENK